jgi:hypothetical protein
MHTGVQRAHGLCAKRQEALRNKSSWHVQARPLRGRSSWNFRVVPARDGAGLAALHHLVRMEVDQRLVGGGDARERMFEGDALLRRQGRGALRLVIALRCAASAQFANPAAQSIKPTTDAVLAGIHPPPGNLVSVITNWGDVRRHWAGIATRSNPDRLHSDNEINFGVRREDQRIKESQAKRAAGQRCSWSHHRRVRAGCTRGRRCRRGLRCGGWWSGRCRRYWRCRK